MIDTELCWTTFQLGTREYVAMNSGDTIRWVVRRADDGSQTWTVTRYDVGVAVGEVVQQCKTSTAARAWVATVA